MTKPTAKLTAKVGNETITVNGVFEVVEKSHITVRVNSRDDALLACYYYRFNTCTIERAADGGWLVVVFTDNRI